ncbi:MAG: type II secretion system protein GspK [Kiloniellales bacterium]|nr:type II secretion system protein GspK [Kiloniellales bacterium]
MKLAVRSSRKRHASKGIALVSVLWGLALIALVAASIATTTRTDLKLVSNVNERAEAEALAEAGVSLGIHGLLKPVVRGGLRVDGTVYEWHLGGGRVRVAIVDEGGKVDLNTAPTELLQRLAFGLVDDESRSTALADAIVDFRDPDRLRRLNGAEEDDYRRAGMPFGPKNFPFESIYELKQVLGMTDPLFLSLAPAVTVHTGKRIPDWRVAAPALAKAIPEVEERQRNALAPADSQAESEWPEHAPRILKKGLTAFRSNARVYTVHAEGASDGDGYAALDVVVRIQRSPTEPYRILEWRPGFRELFGS